MDNLSLGFSHKIYSATGDFMKNVPTATCALVDRQIVSIERVYTPSTFYMKSSVSFSKESSEIFQTLFVALLFVIISLFCFKAFYIIKIEFKETFRKKVLNLQKRKESKRQIGKICDSFSFFLFKIHSQIDKQIPKYMQMYRQIPRQILKSKVFYIILIMCIIIYVCMCKQKSSPKDGSHSLVKFTEVWIVHYCKVHRNMDCTVQ